MGDEEIESSRPDGMDLENQWYPKPSIKNISANFRVIHITLYCFAPMFFENLIICFELLLFCCLKNGMSVITFQLAMITKRRILITLVLDLIT